MPVAKGHGQSKNATMPISFVLLISTDQRFQMRYIMFFELKWFWSYKPSNLKNANFHTKVDIFLYNFVSEDFYSVIYSEFHPLWNFQDNSDCLDVNVDILMMKSI